MPPRNLNKLLCLTSHKYTEREGCTRPLFIIIIFFLPECLLTCPNLPVSFPIATSYLTGVVVAKKDTRLKIIGRLTESTMVTTFREWAFSLLNQSISYLSHEKPVIGSVWCSQLSIRLDFGSRHDLKVRSSKHQALCWPCEACLRFSFSLLLPLSWEKKASLLWFYNTQAMRFSHL